MKKIIIILILLITSYILVTSLNAGFQAKKVTIVSKSEFCNYIIKKST